jgi:hypothetical protein
MRTPPAFAARRRNGSVPSPPSARRQFAGAIGRLFGAVGGAARGHVHAEFGFSIPWPGIRGCPCRFLLVIAWRRWLRPRSMTLHRHAFARRVDHLAVEAGRAFALRLGFFQFLDDALGRVTSASGGEKTSLARAIWLGWMAHLPSIPSAAARRRGDVALGVGKIAEGPVDGAQPVGPAGNHHPRDGRNATGRRGNRGSARRYHGARPHRGRVIGHAEMQRTPDARRIARSPRHWPCRARFRSAPRARLRV